MTELGNKHECLSCSTKFYDLGKSQLICPQCGADQKELAEAGEGADAKKKPKKKAKAAKKKPKKKAKAEPEKAGELDENQSPDSADEE